MTVILKIRCRDVDGSIPHHEAGAERPSKDEGCGLCRRRVWLARAFWKKARANAPLPPDMLVTTLLSEVDLFLAVAEAFAVFLRAAIVAAGAGHAFFELR